MAEHEISRHSRGLSYPSPYPCPSPLEAQVVLPFCDEEQYSTCIIDKETLGLYYGFIDAFLVILLIAGYFWVSSFILDEFEVIKRNTVTAGGKLLSAYASILCHTLQSCHGRGCTFGPRSFSLRGS